MTKLCMALMFACATLVAFSPSAFADTKPTAMKSPMAMKMKMKSSTKLHTTSKSYNKMNYQKPVSKPTP